MANEKNPDHLEEPAWADWTGPGYEGLVEDWCGKWRERHPLAYLELAEMCGLAEPVPGNPRYWRERERPASEGDRPAAVFEALKILIKIDPDGRR